MGILDLLENTVEGVVETSVGAAKSLVGLVIDPLDMTGLSRDGEDQMREGVPKIGRPTGIKKQTEK